MANEHDVTKRGRGRPPKSESIAKNQTIRERISLKMGPDYVRITAASEMFSDNEFVDKMEGITNHIRDLRVQASNLKLDSARSRALAAPWLSTVMPDTLCESLLQEHTAAQEIIEYLEMHLVDYMMLRASLERRMKLLDVSVGSKLDDIPDGIVALARRLHAAGLSSNNAAKISIEDVTELAQILKARDASDSMASLDIFSRPPRPTKAEIKTEVEVTVARADAILREVEAAREPLPEVTLPDDNVIPKPRYGLTWNDPVAGAPPEFWDAIVETGMPYRWEHRLAVPGEKSIMTFPFPVRDSWESLVEADLDFAESAKDFKFTVESLEEMAAEYLSYIQRMVTDRVPLEWKKAWILLLWARHHPDQMIEILGDKATTYFTGVGVPYVQMGGRNIRILVPIRS